MVEIIDFVAMLDVAGVEIIDIVLPVTPNALDGTMLYGGFAGEIIGQRCETNVSQCIIIVCNETLDSFLKVEYREKEIFVEDRTKSYWAVGCVVNNL